MHKFRSSERIMIFGGTGSLGRTLIKRFMAKDVNAILPFSRDEAKHWTLKNELEGMRNADRVKFIVGDIRDLARVREAFFQYKPTTVIIAAALKQVDTCELSPNESVQTNLLGTQNVVRAANEYAEAHDSLKHVLFVSTDKACSPVNVYGMCKAISERVVTSQSASGNQRVQFMGVRYGNVLESRGSIIPLFRYQAEHAAAFTITDPDMTRFLMTLDDSVNLIEKTITEGKSGEIWVPRLKAMRIGDLANIFSWLYNKPVKSIGLRPGEKMNEALVNSSEAPRTRALGDTHYIIGPAHTPGTESRFDYTSADDVMTESELYKHLGKLGIFEKKLAEFEGATIEEIRK